MSETKTGLIVEVKPGDLLIRIGGRTPSINFQRRYLDDIVVRTYRLPRARTRMHVELQRCGTIVLDHRYPAEFRALTLEEIEARTNQGRGPAKTLSPDEFEAARARGAARRAARR